MKERPILFSGPMVKAIHPKMQQWNESRRVVIDDDQVSRLFHEGRTAVEIANVFGCSSFPIKQSLKRLRLSRPANRRKGEGSGHKNPAWRGGRRIRRDGYVVIWTPNGDRLEHQVVMEKNIGRPLRKGEVVHHIDGNKENNTVENLKITTKSSHIREHLKDMQTARYGKLENVPSYFQGQW